MQKCPELREAYAKKVEKTRKFEDNLLVRKLQGSCVMYIVRMLFSSLYPGHWRSCVVYMCGFQADIQDTGAAAVPCTCVVFTNAALLACDVPCSSTS